MKIAAVCQHDRGGVTKMATAVVNAVNTFGHPCDLYTLNGAAFDRTFHDYDLVHFFNAGSALQCQPSIPLTVTIHHMTLGYEDGYCATLRKVAPERIHVIDHFTQRDLGRRGFYNVTYIPLLIDAPHDPLPYPEEFSVGYLGGDSLFKGFGSIEAAARLLNIPCSGHNSDNGWISKAEIRELYKRMSVYAVASFEDGGPIPPIEALSHGRPVITTYVGSMPEYVEHGENGLFYDGSVEGLCMALEEVRANWAHYRDRVKQLWKQRPPAAMGTAKRYVDMWRTVCEK